MKTMPLIREFLASRRSRNMSPKTIEWYEYMLYPFARQNQELPTTSKRIEKFLGGIGGSDETRHCYFRALSTLYHFASKRRHIDNPITPDMAPRRRRKVPYSLGAAELGCLLAVRLSRRDRALVNLLLDTGVRISEAINLTVRDVLEDSIMVDGKTGERDVPISPETRDQLLDLSPVGLLFLGEKGPLTRSGGYRIVKLALRAAGIPARKRGPHVLRHTFGRHYIMAGGDIFSLQRILGHSSLETTKIYVGMDLRDITHQHHQFTPLKRALVSTQGQN